MHFHVTGFSASLCVRIVDEIKGLLKKKECEIYALDESHFSTEPYLVQGWFKKRWLPQDPDTLQPEFPSYCNEAGGSTPSWA